MKKFLVVIALISGFLLFGNVSFANNLRDGMEYYKIGNYEKSEKFFRKVLLLDSNNNSARYMLAVSLVQRKKYNEAKQLYKSIVINSENDRLVNLSQAGLRNLGDNADYYWQNSITRATININSAGTVMIIDKVKLNDKLNGKFIFDTGATYTTISKTVAAKLNISIKGAQNIKIMTGSGYINAPLVKIDKIEVKGLVVNDVEVIITDLPSHSSGNSQGVVGLLGLSFLENFKIIVDRSNGKITLEKN